MFSDLEDLLLKHPDVDDVAVIGIDLLEQATEAPRAYGTSLPHPLSHFTGLTLLSQSSFPPQQKRRTRTSKTSFQHG